MSSKQTTISNYGYSLNEDFMKTLLIAPFLKFNEPTPSGHVFKTSTFDKVKPVQNCDVTFHFNADAVVGRLLKVTTNKTEAIATIELNKSNLALKILETPVSYQLGFAHTKNNIVEITVMVMGDKLTY